MATNAPHAIGIIMDGNRRWAKERGLPTLEGHRKGSEKIRDVCRWAYGAGVKEVILYAFSTENWNRSPEEVSYLLDLFEEALPPLLKDIRKEGGRIRFIGERERFPEKLQGTMRALEEESADGTRGTLAIALSYGGRSEILAAVNALLARRARVADEASLKEAMWSAGLRDPDLIIRTGGEQRLSNFLTWQSAYSELFFTETKWPDFSKEEFDVILEAYGARERRHGI